MTETLRQRAWVVFEGPDGTGKTTQWNLLKELWGEDQVCFTHSPSGNTGFTQLLYEVLERMKGNQLPPLARQFMHLAAHEVMYQKEIAPSLATGKSVVLDRFWWSAIAYGWYAQGLDDRVGDLDLYQKMVMLPAMNMSPDIIFYFTHVYEEDDNNLPGVEMGYKHIYRWHKLWAQRASWDPRGIRPPRVVALKEGDKWDIHKKILSSLASADLLTSPPDQG